MSNDSCDSNVALTPDILFCSLQDILKRRRFRKGDPGFSFTFAVLVGLIGLMVGFLLNLSLSSPSTEWLRRFYSGYQEIFSWQIHCILSLCSVCWKVCFTSFFVYWWLLQICIMISWFIEYVSVSPSCWILRTYATFLTLFGRSREKNLRITCCISLYYMQWRVPWKFLLLLPVW